MTKYQPIIGLEIHIELKTKTKMFCDCLNNSQEKQPNKNICPICLGYPGTLPTINKKALEHVLRTGLAVGAEILKNSRFDRKNYFYPDLPKGYQISQYNLPLCQGGKLKLFLSPIESLSNKEIRIRRIHLEEDTARLIHQGVSHFQTKESFTLIDFNRCGVPLMELVTEPDIHSAEEAKLFGQCLQLLLRYLDASEADMEKGQMRIEVNISLTKISDTKLGTKVEIKNLNSFQAVAKAIEYEIKRQTKILEKKEKIIQETRGWDDIKEITYPQRIKEEAQDYRYFPEPDLPPIFPTGKLKLTLPELPWARKERLAQEYNLTPEAIIILIQDKKLNDYFEKTISELKTQAIFCKDKNCQKELTNLALNYLITDLKGLMVINNISWEKIKISPDKFAKLLYFLYQKEISSRGAKIVLEEIIKTGGEPEDIIRQKKLTKIQDAVILKKIVQEIIVSYPQAVKDYQGGKINALQFLVGQAMKRLKDAGDPQALQKIFVDELK